MTAADSRAQRLRLVPGRFVVEHLPAAVAPPSGWIAQVRAPEGLTVVREVVGPEPAGVDLWRALYGGDSAHGLDLPGMLAALLEPLAAAAVPVFVASTYHADLVLVPEPAAERAVEALRAAGHTVDR
ncbi:ACT domain-containing protein [Catenulispora pinisilvae]|uniref:ACT domain-containing protein n=1 Tax=Catenulispora pinisilvae TaxID=2705253 RepID=UPI0018919CFE|nr:ACT domain-containing protein [Catenulispora pinisilvae]